MKTSRTRKPNWLSRCTPATARKHRIIAALLAQGDGLTMTEIGRALGMSRQLTLYHVKKMAAAGMIVMVSEPCERNGGLQWRAWDELALAAHYSRKMLQSPKELMRHAA